MQIKIGITRIVFFTNKQAIKIARIRLIYYFFRGFRRLISRNKRAEYIENHGGVSSSEILSFFTKGIRANNREYSYWESSKDYKRVVPVLKRIFSGLIIIQPRGEAVTKEELLAGYPLENKFRVMESNIDEPNQFCKIDGAIKLADYGDEVTYNLLMQN